MESKYYTPETSEFYQGFEYEKKSGFNDGTVKTKEQFEMAKWVKATTDVFDIVYINRALHGRNNENNLCGIRVKFLDREDIEELGGKVIEGANPFRIEGGEEKEGLQYQIGKARLCHYPDNTVHIFEVYFINDEPAKPFTLFNGTIKNKSQLRLILNSTNII